MLNPNASYHGVCAIGLKIKPVEVVQLTRAIKIFIKLVVHRYGCPFTFFLKRPRVCLTAIILDLHVIDRKAPCNELEPGHQPL